MRRSKADMNGKTYDMNFSGIFRNYGPLILLVLFVVATSLINPKFMSFSNLRNVLFQVSTVGVVALGAMFVILTAGIDFTAGVGVAFAGVCAGVVFGITRSAAVLILTAVGIGLLIGAINGLIITRLRIQPFIATLAMMSVIQGLIYVVSEGKIVFLTSPVVDFIGKGNMAGIPTPFVIFLVMSAISYVILNRTKIGIYAYAMGGNEEGARLAGVDLKRYKLYIYMLAGLMTGISAVIMICRISMVAPNIGGNILLDAIASTIIGGTSISGGKGTVGGTLVGVLLIGMISNALNIINVPAVWQDVVKGLIIIVALYFDVIVVNRKKK
ncbi:ABC transporter permease [Biomaibacter acetigenes]|uniref:ABC transporter permease n=1 Tax=Biomaibacter acetigenes TaxID=2316383 RepID=A0A3G2R167_9FIRM|nr:ABC transporter permease [Biomaibacter acetigenes]AYO29206.1 ABC transporter permease [Biomaibacter acetigenes]